MNEEENKVEVTETRPLSKMKRFRVVRIIEKAPQNATME